MGLISLSSLQPSEPTLLALLGLGALLLELGAVRLPEAGFVSIAPACYLAALLSPTLGVGWAFCLAAPSLLLRSLSRGNRQGSLRLLEGLVELAPVALTAAGLIVLRLVFPDCPEWVVALVALEIYLPCILKFPELLRPQLAVERRGLWVEARKATAPVLFGAVCLGVALALVARQASLYVLWLAPVLAALSTQAGASRDQVERADRERLEAELVRTRQAQVAGERRGRELRQELHKKLDEYLVLDELSRGLAVTTTTDECLQVLLKKLAGFVACESLVVFHHDGGVLTPRAYKSPFEAKLADFQLLKSREPLVERCLQSRQPTALDPADEERVFQGEQAALGLPIEDFGVLYAGRKEEKFNEQETRFLSLAAVQASVALRSVSRLESQQQALRVREATHAELEERAQGLAALAEGTRAALSSLDPSTIYVSLLERVGGLAAFDAAVVLSGDAEQPVVEKAENLEEQGLLELVQPLCQAVAAAGRPLLFENIDESRFVGLKPGQQSLLAVPVKAETSILGFLVLSKTEAAAYKVEHQDLVLLLAYQAAAALESARAHQETARAYKLLQESKAQMFQSSKMAAVGQLAAGVAHELNTPLGSTIIAIEAAEMYLELKPEAAKEKLAIALRESLRAKDIIAKMLYYSRDARYGKDSLDLNKVVEDTLTLHQHQFSLDDIVLEAELKPVSTISGNENEIQQILVNLLLNARDALAECADSRVQVSTEEKDGYLWLRVSDSGPGIEPDTQERIFEPFFTTKPVGRGTGLGLSVSRQLAESHGGELLLEESAPGRTVLALKLPLGPPSATPSEES